MGDTVNTNLNVNSHTQRKLVNCIWRGESVTKKNATKDIQRFANGLREAVDAKEMIVTTCILLVQAMMLNKPKHTKVICVRAARIAMKMKHVLYRILYHIFHSTSASTATSGKTQEQNYDSRLES